MLCLNCGNNIEDGQEVCASCGGVVKELEKKFNTEIQQKTKNAWTPSRIIKYVLLLALIIGLFSSKYILSALGLIEQDTTVSINLGLSALDHGDYESAIQHMENAADSAVTAESKLTTLISLGYVYVSAGKQPQAIVSFREALDYTTPNSFYYYLISGELALLAENPEEALQHFNNAYDLRPENFKINNTLNLFYLDIKDNYPNLADHPKALEYAKTAYRVRTPETNEVATENLAIAYFINMDYTQAIEYFKQVDQDQPYVQLWLGTSYFALEDYDTARPYLERAEEAGLYQAKHYLDAI